MASEFLLHWWHIPAIVTVCALAWGYWPRYVYQIDPRIFTMPIALIVSLVAWLVGALCK